MIGDDIGEYSVFRLYHRIGEEIINNFDFVSKNNVFILKDYQKNNYGVFL